LPPSHTFQPLSCRFFKVPGSRDLPWKDVCAYMCTHNASMRSTYAKKTFSVSDFFGFISVHTSKGALQSWGDLMNFSRALNSIQLRLTNHFSIYKLNFKLNCYRVFFGMIYKYLSHDAIQDFCVQYCRGIYNLQCFIELVCQSLLLTNNPHNQY